MTMQEFWSKIYPLILNGTIDRVEKELLDGTQIKAYWAGTIIRVDIKPA